jgi:Protein of unknown function (DUF3617)
MRKLNTVAIVSMIAVALAATSSLLAQDRMRAGQYEVTFTKGGRTTVMTHCITAAVAKAANGDARTLKEGVEKSTAAQNCTSTDFKLEGNVVSFTTVCSGVSVESKTTYSGDSFETVMTTKSPAGVTTTRVRDRRIGDCP